VADSWRNEKNELHRLDGPAVVWSNDNKEWWLNGKRHRLGGPAIEWINGHKEWWIEGRFHRLDGPAVKWSNGDEQWWVMGKKLTQEEFEQHPLVVFCRLTKES
jgi:hypothetical protein